MSDSGFEVNILSRLLFGTMWRSEPSGVGWPWSYAPCGKFQNVFGRYQAQEAQMQAEQVAQMQAEQEAQMQAEREARMQTQREARIRTQRKQAMLRALRAKPSNRMGWSSLHKYVFSEQICKLPSLTTYAFQGILGPNYPLGMMRA